MLQEVTGVLVCGIYIVACLNLGPYLEGALNMPLKWIAQIFMGSSFFLIRLL